MLFIFVDGVGVGPDDPTNNPLASAALPALEALAGRRLVGLEAVAAADHGHPLVPIDSAPGFADVKALGSPSRGRPAGQLLPLDATLGVPGLPQSATGQTTILTGVNAAEAIGRHLGPYPDAMLRGLLAEAGLWSKLIAAGRRVAFANAFPDRYLEGAAAGRARMGAMARAAHLAGVRLRGPADLAAGDAVSAFLTNEGWRRYLGYDMPEASEEEAGRHLARLAASHDFTLFEYFATDMAGHGRDPARARAVLESLDRFVGGVQSEIPADRPILIVSDHGNIEDLSSHRHTVNPALFIWSGPFSLPELRSLADVSGIVLSALGVA